MQIDGTEYHPRPTTGGDLAIIASLLPRLRPHIRPDGADMLGLLELWPEIIDAAEQLLQPVVKPVPPDQPALEQVGGPPDLKALPLHEVVPVLRQLLLEWLSVNGTYIGQQVAPAVTELASAVKAVAEQVGQAANLSHAD